MIKALIFDLDDTLYNEKTYVFGAFREVSKYLSCKYDLNKFQLYEDILNVFNKYGRGKIFDIICNKYNLNEDISKLVYIYRNSKPELNLYEDARKILKWGKNNNLKLGIITDGCSKVQWNKIKSLNLEGIIDKIIVTDDLGKIYSKPHKRAYVDMAKYLNIEYKECIYIGDNSNKDFVGCKKLGVNTVRIIRKQGDHMKTFLSPEYEADKNINNLMEVKGIIKNWTKG